MFTNCPKLKHIAKARKNLMTLLKEVSIYICIYLIFLKFVFRFVEYMCVIIIYDLLVDMS